MFETLLAMDPVIILSFMGAGIILNFTPGVDVMFAMASGVKGGWHVGVAAAVGITLGSIIHVDLAALGISAALATVPHAFDAIRYAGAAYLLYLAVKSWRTAVVELDQNGQINLFQAIKQGFLTNLLNPKVALFILAFLPQFADPTIGPAWHQFVILGVIFTITGLFINAAYGAFAGLLSARIRKNSIILNRVSAVTFGGLAARLALN